VLSTFFHTLMYTIVSGASAALVPVTPLICREKREREREREREKGVK
jgi:hypothetical protein